MTARRLFGAVVLALQVAVTVSWLAESRATQRLDTHADERGTRHANIHDEATCPACALRATHAAPASANRVPSSAEHRVALTPRTAAGPHQVARRTAHTTRAPPAAPA